jgi:integrase
MSNLSTVQKTIPDMKVEKISYIWDDEQTGFGVKLTPSGNHKWVSNKHVNGKKTWMTLGSVQTLTYKQAIEAFRQATHDQGVAAMIRVHREGRNSPTLVEMIDIYAEAKKKNRQIKEAKRELLNAVKLLPDMKIHELTGRDIEFIKSKTESPSTFNRFRRYMSSAWNMAEKLDYFPKDFNGRNPCKKVEAHFIKPRDVFLEADEFKRVWDSTACDWNILVKQIIQLVCLTGARKEEITSLQWADIDYEKSIITFRDTKNRSDHKIMITPIIHQVLRTVERLDDAWLFPSHTKKGHIQNIVKPWKRIKKRAGVRDDVTIHDLRRSVATYLMNNTDAKLEDIGKALNHKTLATTNRVYAIATMESKAKVLTKLEDLFVDGVRLRVLK